MGTNQAIYVHVALSMSMAMSSMSACYHNIVHCHKRLGSGDVDSKARRKLIIACILCISFIIVEVIGTCVFVFGFVVGGLSLTHTYVHLA